MASLSRRTFLQAVAAGIAVPFVEPRWGQERLFRIRTITAGIHLDRAGDVAPVNGALGFLRSARDEFVEHDFEVQTVRIATQPVSEYLSDWHTVKGIAALKELDGRVAAGGATLSIGPVLTDGAYNANFARFAAELIRQTQVTNFSVIVASAGKGVQPDAARAAAEAMRSIAVGTGGGEGNFRFAAIAFCPPGPFFPAAYHEGDPGFSLGLETPPLLKAVFQKSPTLAQAKSNLRLAMNQALSEVEGIGIQISRKTGWPYLGIDTSPAPLTGASIGEAIETLTGTPFGETSTLAACAAITDVLKELDVKTCGYCGLMLPVLEDPVLARRAAEGRYSVSELLLYSSVCGTGLDVVPLPGDTGAEQLAGVITDVGALAAKYTKPLSARLFPVPGKAAGDTVRFDNPYLTPSVVMRLS